MKVLFLDIDGVVNCKNTQQRHLGAIGIEPEKMEVVKRIVRHTGCKIVLSSSWRLSPPDLAHVRECIELLDVTPDNRGLTDRGCEVKAWLEHHPEVSRYAILDDSSDFHKDQPLFKTTWEQGLTDGIAHSVIDHLAKDQN